MAFQRRERDSRPGLGDAAGEGAIGCSLSGDPADDCRPVEAPMLAGLVRGDHAALG